MPTKTHRAWVLAAHSVGLVLASCEVDALEYCMDRLNDGSFRAPQDASSGDTRFTDGLILWRLSNRGHSDLWCMVFEFPGAFYFVVDDDPEGTHPYHVHEQHSDIVSLVNRAEALKGALIEFGWVDVDVE